MNTKQKAEKIVNCPGGYTPESVEVAKWALHIEEDKKILKQGIIVVGELMAASRGVDGLHLNGDIATWSELLEGGRFEEWLIDFETAHRLVESED